MWGISLFSEKEENYDSDITDKTDPDQAKSKHWVLKLNGVEATSDLGVKLKAALCSHYKVNASL